MNKTIWIVITAVIILGIGSGAYFYFKKSKVTTTDSTSSALTTPATNTKTTSTKTWTKGAVAVSGTFADADTVKLADDSYRMYYSIQPEVTGNKLQVYSATSTDGITWEQEAGERKTMATFPEVIQLTDKTFRMYFQNAGVIKSATSSDGLTWKDESGTRIDATNDLGLKFDNVAAPTVTAQKDGTFLMVYRGTINTPYVGEQVPNKDTQLLLWATSADGLTWTKKGLAIDTRNTTLYGLGDGPELFLTDEGAIKLSFWSYTGVFWADVTATGFGAPEKVFEANPSTAMNKFPANTAGDPVYAQFNNVWYMYYGQKDGIHYAVLK